MNILKFLTCILVCLHFATGPLSAENVLEPPSDAYHYMEIPPDGLPSFLAWRPVRLPLVSHHRGGPAPGYPENAIETMQHALRYGPGLMEVDVAMLGDGTLVLMHDDTLDRTTTGKGAISDATWEYVSKLFLVDEAGNRTDFRVPRLMDVLKWAVGRVILTLDIKRGTDFARVAAEIDATRSRDYVIAISYSLDQARAFHAVSPVLALSVTIRNQEELDAVLSSDLPTDRLVAWTGTRIVPGEIYNAIHKQGWRVIVGTLGNPSTSMDGEIYRSGSQGRYLQIFQYGADIISTDRFWAVQNEIRNPNLFFFVKQPNDRKSLRMP